MTFIPPSHCAGARAALPACALLLVCASPFATLAATDKLLLTGGVSTIEGAAGGGLSPWAVIGQPGHARPMGRHRGLNEARTQDYRLHVASAALAWDDRLELSIARQRFDTGATGTALGLPGLTLKQDIVGAKLRLAGEAILDSDRWMPQLALGLQSKRLDAGGLAPTLAALGARASGVDGYLSATKLLLGQGLLLNATLRATKANQGGLLGFGGTAQGSYRLQPELSFAWLLHRSLAVGMEYRAKPDNLNPSALGQGLKEDDWYDLFVAWAPHKQVSITAAFVNLGAIVPAVKPGRQTGGYLSLQLAH